MGQLYPYAERAPTENPHADLRGFSFNLAGTRVAWTGDAGGGSIAVWNNTTQNNISVVAPSTAQGALTSSIGYGHDGNIYGLTGDGKIVSYGTDGSSVTLLTSIPIGAHIASAVILKNATDTFVCCLHGSSWPDWNFYDVNAAAWTSVNTQGTFYSTKGAWVNAWALDLDGNIWGFGTQADQHGGDLVTTMAVAKFVSGSISTTHTPTVPSTSAGGSQPASAFHRDSGAVDQFVVNWNYANTIAVNRSTGAADITTANVGGYPSPINNLAANSATYWTLGGQASGSPKQYSSDDLSLIQTVDGSLWVSTTLGSYTHYDWRNNALINMSQDTGSFAFPLVWRFFRFVYVSVSTRIGQR